ncbi:MAG: hypothetical protein HYZ86_01875 [Candidatus Omnitrophica bacterium]|nr:hypothetical protein [Candidatus Omnitrophota bacterium]
MLTYLNQKTLRGQSTLEYAVLVVIIIGALLSIQFYIKRGVQGRLKSAADDIGDQYSVGNTNVLKTTHTQGTTLETFNTGVSKSEIQGNEITNTTERSVVLNIEQEYMGQQ